jgi:chromosome segregation ATPase
MNGFLQTLGRLMVAACVAAIMIPAAAEAQVRLLGSDSEGWTVQIESGARMWHLARALGVEPDMEEIARLNPGHIIYVCYDNIGRERPSMSRVPAFYETCTDHARERWFVAGLTYRIPNGETIPVLESVSTSSTAGSTDPDRIASLERELEEANAAVESAGDEAHEVRADARRARDRAGELEHQITGLSWLVVVCFLLFLLMGAAALYVLYRTRRTIRRIMGHARRERAAWSRYAVSLRKSKATIENKIGMLTRGITEASNELTRSLVQQGRLRKRIRTYFVQRQELRKLLLAASNLIQSFQRQRQEDDDRRTRIPNLLKIVDDGRRQWNTASAARNRIILIKKWRQEVDAVDYPDILFDTYDRMIAEDREIELRAEALIAEANAARESVVEDFYALTGLRTDSIDPEGRLKKSIDAADKNAELLHAQSEALADLIRLHMGQMAEFHARDEAIKSREAEVATAEAELVRRMKEFDARVERWERAHEQKSDVAAWTGGLARLEVGRVSDIEARLAELEGRVSGFERRAISAEDMLQDANAFIDVVQPRYKQAMELLEGIKKGPNFLEARTIQMAEYIKQLEDRLGIVRTSAFGGLPEIEYGAYPPKAKA